MTPPLLTTAEFAEARGMALSTVKSYCSRGKIPSAQYDARLRRWMIPAGAEVVRRKRGRKPKKNPPTG